MVPVIDMVPNFNIELEKVSYGLRYGILILINDMKLTYLLPGHLHTRAVRYLFAKIMKLTVLDLNNLSCMKYR